MADLFFVFSKNVMLCFQGMLILDVLQADIKSSCSSDVF